MNIWVRRTGPDVSRIWRDPGCQTIGTWIKSNLIILQQDATYSVHYIYVGSSICFGCWHPSICSSYSCNYSFWYRLTGSTTIHSRCWVGKKRYMKVDRLYLVLISLKDWVNPKTTARPEVLSLWRIPMTLSGIETATFRLVGHWLNQLRHRLPFLNVKYDM